MGSSNQKSKNAARRARIEELRRAEQARERRNRLITIGVSVVVVAGLVAGGYTLWSAGEEKEQAAAAPIEGVKSWSDLSQNHVTTAVDYPMTPPVGGDHNQIWVNCDKQVYTNQLPNENAVHALEHGAVWITYNDEAAEADVEQLTDKVERTTYTFMSPYEEQSSPITLSAWGHQLNVDSASDARVQTFLDKYVQGEQTPEPGAACTGGLAP
ncbi:DUF3105 domain-containing protein [Streptomyces sp. CRN 30]|uniref:DUF3105 domain-containing protein n=1 Tax=Streptomyces sp. CRN 30 TaxID=3075613 RepID=UPI002A83156F|nr:DUF3105 domain-containing protein [Streptomyces sp. CRN 30]